MGGYGRFWANRGGYGRISVALSKSVPCVGCSFGPLILGLFAQFFFFFGFSSCGGVEAKRSFSGSKKITPPPPRGQVEISENHVFGVFGPPDRPYFRVLKIWITQMAVSSHNHEVSGRFKARNGFRCSKNGRIRGFSRGRGGGTLTRYPPQAVPVHAPAR